MIGADGPRRRNPNLLQAGPIWVLFNLKLRLRQRLLHLLPRQLQLPNHKKVVVAIGAPAGVQPMRPADRRSNHPILGHSPARKERPPGGNRAAVRRPRIPGPALLRLRLPLPYPLPQLLPAHPISPPNQRPTRPGEKRPAGRHRRPKRPVQLLALLMQEAGARLPNRMPVWPAGVVSNNPVPRLK